MLFVVLSNPAFSAKTYTGKIKGVFMGPDHGNRAFIEVDRTLLTSS